MNITLGNMQIVMDQQMKERTLLGNVTFIQISIVDLMERPIVVFQHLANAIDILAISQNLRELKLWRKP